MLAGFGLWRRLSHTDQGWSNGVIPLPGCIAAGRSMWRSRKTQPSGEFLETLLRSAGTFGLMVGACGFEDDPTLFECNTDDEEQ